jgi:hypothetical protein
MDAREMEWEVVDWMYLAQGPVPWFCEQDNKPSGSIKAENFSTVRAVVTSMELVFRTAHGHEISRMLNYLELSQRKTRFTSTENQSMCWMSYTEELGL